MAENVCDLHGFHNESQCPWCVCPNPLTPTRYNPHAIGDDSRVREVLEGRAIVSVSGGRHGLFITLDDGHVFTIDVAETYPLLHLQFDYRAAALEEVDPHRGCD